MRICIGHVPTSEEVQANAFVTSPLEMIYHELHFSPQNSVDTQYTGHRPGLRWEANIVRTVNTEFRVNTRP